MKKLIGNILKFIFEKVNKGKKREVYFMGIKVFSYITKNRNLTYTYCKIEKNLLLENFKIFNPKSQKIKVYLLNNTKRDIGHLGCETVINAINELCNKNGMEIIYYDSDFPTADKDISSYEYVLSACDIVIFNGEGTLHHDAGINMFEKCSLAKKLGKKVFLINSIWQNNNIVNSYLDIFDLITVRESFSRLEINKVSTKDPEVVPDLTFYSKINTNSDTYTKTIFTDSVYSSLTRKLYNKSKKLGKDFYYMRIGRKNRNNNILNYDTLKSLSSNSQIITGRFHALTLAMKLGIPTLAIPSNTHKIEGVLKDADLGKYYTKDLSKIDEFIIGNHKDYKKKSEIYCKNAVKKIDTLFEKIADITKE